MIKELYNRLDRIERLLEENHHNNVIYLNIDETSEFIKMKKSSIYQLVFQRKIPYFKRGKILLFDKAELVRWIEDKKVKTFEDLAEKVNLDKIIDKYKGKDYGLAKWKTKTD
jgi:predicted DNA-binding transcriptional regulator AlpA